MNQKQTVRCQFYKKNFGSGLLGAGQLAVLVVVAAALLWPAPFTQNQLFGVWPDSDLVFSQWPFALLIQRTFAQTHQLPFWNPYFGGGQPVGANPLATLFYPSTLLVHFFSLRNYFLIVILGHLIFAGLGMLLLSRWALKLPRFPALVTAICYMATPRLISHLGAGHITIVQTVAWYPWLALTCWVTICVSWHWGAFLGVCIGLTLLAGHPQMAYYGLLLTFGLAIWLLIRRWRLGRRFPTLVSLAVASVIGVLLAGVHLLPLLELTAHSTRQSSLSAGDAFPLLDFLHALFFLPSPQGTPWEEIISPGLLALTLALLAAVRCWHRVWPLVLGIILVALLAMGNASFLYIVVSRILPGLDLFRGLARIWFIALLLIALMAGVGADWLLSYIRHVMSHEKFPPNFRDISTAIAGFLIVLIVAYSLIITDISYSRTGDISAVTTPSPLALVATHLAGYGRVYSEQENISQTNAVQLQTRLADGWDPLLISSYTMYMQLAGNYAHTGYTLHIPYDSSSVQPNATLLGWMNVSVVVSKRPLTDPLLVQVGEVDGTLIYKNTANAGPAYLVEPGANNASPVLERMQRLDTPVRVVTIAPEQETFTFSNHASGYFVIATPMFPGWTATLDGHPVRIQLVANVMPAIKVGAGKHVLSYTYTPSYVRLGAVLSTFGGVATLAWIIAGYYFKPRKTRLFWLSEANDLKKKQTLDTEKEGDKRDAYAQAKRLADLGLLNDIE